MAGQYPYPPHPPAGGGRRGFPWLAVLGSLALVLVLVVGVTVVLVLGKDDASKDRPSTSEALRERLLEGERAELPTTAEAEEAVPGYDYTAPISGVGVDDDLIIPATYDADAEDPWQGDPGKIEVYADQALTRPVPILILPDPASSAAEPHLAITPLGLKRSHITRRDGQVKGTLADLGTYWNLNPHVYVVQYLEPDGSKRARPLVTQVDFTAETPAPAQITSSVTPQGDAFLQWSRVPDATEYLVVLQQRKDSSLDDTVQVVGRTTDTNWSSAVTKKCLHSCTQNDLLKLTTVDASTMVTSPQLVPEKVDARLGVIAVVDRQPSVMTPIDFTGLAALPVRSDRKWDQGADLANRGLAALPSRFLYVSIEGSTRATGAFVDRAEVRRKGSDWEVPLRGQGTRLVDPVLIPAAAVDDIDAAVAAFNERAQGDYPPAGLSATTIVVRTDLPQQPSPELPPPDYPVFGSNELTRFIAGQLIAGSTAIDVSELAGQPGLPELQDALTEAVYQNPYALSYFDKFSFDGSVVHVESAFTQAEKQAHQKDIENAAKATVKDVIKDGMTVSEKVSALNRYLVDQADYDHTALASSPGKYRSDIPAQFRYAWETHGILVDHSGVCMSYAYAFHALAEEAGVESVVVTGELADGGGHAWNKVKVGGNWRAVDVTWNDPRGPWTPSTGTRYLMIRDAEFTGSALRSEDDDWMADAYLSQYPAR
ncbi:transglutaminase domain-containing protein [Nocardioides sp. LHD-245]|uniref:transglutaminase domain-containing protein n=1 Tax=Nocardioides sp. LHD-245 TaxID=3051387 RepID=UPI0027E0B440|nr:transglutaminase domain-containing protein [Nocardioides sp. LHD-245]